MKGPTMAIKCGSTGHSHETVAQVRSCQLGGTVMTAPPAPSAEVRLSSEEVSDRLRRQAANTRYGSSSGGSGYPFRPASEKMVNWVRDILANREVDSANAAQVQRALDGHGGIGFQTAKKFIDAWKDAPRKAKKATGSAERPAPEIEDDGIYRHPETKEWFKVQWNKAGGDGRRLYAKRLVVESEAERDDDGKIVKPSEIRWEYAPGVAATIKPEWKATKADAAEFGALYGRCQACRRVLTLEESIERAMGRICWDKTA